jgi:hypothetical protein
MKRPLSPGSAIDGKRFKRWLDLFGSYRTGVINATIQSWLEQFEDADRDLAARVLDAVEFYGLSQIHTAFRDALNALDGWHRAPSKRKGKWRFAAMSGSAGESGDNMLYHFRVANSLDTKSDNELFVSRSDLFRQPLLADGDPHKLGVNDTVVLLDDFCGTGTQVCEAWNDPETSFGALLAGVGKVYLIVVAASKAARQRIKSETELHLVHGHEYQEGDDVFSDKCKHFSSKEQKRLLEYCEVADRKAPRGYGDCGLIVVFQHRTPSNSIPVLHADHSKWTGLFPRHE